MVGSPLFFCFFVTIYDSLERAVKLTMKKLKKMIREQLDSKPPIEQTEAFQRLYELGKYMQQQMRKGTVDNDEMIKLTKDYSSFIQELINMGFTEQEIGQALQKAVGPIR